MKPAEKKSVSIPSIARKIQLAFVVQDAKKVAEGFSKLGIGPFIEEIYPGIEAKVHGKSADYRLLAFTANLGPVELEICQVLEGNPIHKEFLDKKGDGIHHIGIYVDDFDKQVEKWKSSGLAVLQESRLPPPYPKEGGYAFFDTEKMLGVILELANPPPEALKTDQGSNSASHVST